VKSDTVKSDTVKSDTVLFKITGLTLVSSKG